MQYHEVKINLELNDVKSLYWAADTSSGRTYSSNPNGLVVGDLVSASLYVDYIYLDTDERRRFAQVSHEYLLLKKREKATTHQHADPVGVQMCRHSAESFVFNHQNNSAFLCCC